MFMKSRKALYVGEPRAVPMVGGLKVGAVLAWLGSIKFGFYLFDSGS
jgi:hypothetical protein